MEIFVQILMWILGILIWFNVIGWSIVVGFSVLGGVVRLFRGLS